MLCLSSALELLCFFSNRTTTTAVAFLCVFSTGTAFSRSFFLRAAGGCVFSCSATVGSVRHPLTKRTNRRFTHLVLIPLFNRRVSDAMNSFRGGVFIHGICREMCLYDSLSVPGLLACLLLEHVGFYLLPTNLTFFLWAHYCRYTACCTQIITKNDYQQYLVLVVALNPRSPCLINQKQKNNCCNRQLSVGSSLA